MDNHYHLSFNKWNYMIIYNVCIDMTVYCLIAHELSGLISIVALCGCPFCILSITDMFGAKGNFSICFWGEDDPLIWLAWYLFFWLQKVGHFLSIFFHFFCACVCRLCMRVTWHFRQEKSYGGTWARRLEHFLVWKNNNNSILYADVFRQQGKTLCTWSTM